MRNIEEWIHDKPVLLALTSLEYTFLAPKIYEYFQDFGTEEGRRNLNNVFPLPPFNEWIEMYENSSVILTVMGILGNANELLFKLVNLIEPDRVRSDKDALIKEIKKQAFSTPGELKSLEATKKIQDNYWLQISKMRLDLMQAELSEVDGLERERIRELFNSPVVPYAARVLVPSLLLYQRNPQDLFREARSGKLDSLAKLLIIDKEILRDETIFGVFKEAAQPDKELDYNMLTKAFRQTPADLVTLKKVKVAVARFILDLSKLMGHRLTINEIRGLYDRIEKDREGNDAAIDEDGLYDSEDSFYKAVMRHPGYESLFPPRIGQNILELSETIP